MLKVLEVCTVSSSCYALVFKRALAVMQQSHEPIQVDLLCTEGKEVALMQAQGVNVITTTLHRSLNPLRLLQSTYRLWQIINKSDYGIIHLHFGIPGLVGRLIASLDRKRHYIYQSHGYSVTEQTSWLAKQLFLGIELLFRKSVRYSLFQLQEDIKLAKKHHLLSDEQIIYLGNGVDLEQFQPTCSKLTLGSKDKLTFGMVARFEPIKNHALLLQAVQQLVQQRRDFQVLLIGQGPLRDAIQAQILAQNLSDYIKILPYRHDMQNFYQLLDIGMLTSYGEGIPRALIEPMACGKPVLATHVKGCREVIIDQQTGLLTPLDQPAQLAKQMAWFIEHPEERLQMGKAAREYALAHFSEQTIITRLGDIYRQIAKLKPNAPYSQSFSNAGA